MDSLWQLPFFMVLFFIGLTITPALAQPQQTQPPPCSDMSPPLNCNFPTCSPPSPSSSFNKPQIPDNSSSLYFSGPNCIDSSVIPQISNDNNENSDKSGSLLGKVHGILSGIGWGILMPIAAMMGCYLRSFEASKPSWIDYHRAYKFVAFIFGIIGAAFGIGIVITGDLIWSTHGLIGLVICLASTFQMFVFCQYRPKEGDRGRIFSDIFHYLFGYGVIVLTIINMLNGYFNSNSSSSHHGNKAWKIAFLVIIVCVCVLAFVYENITWFLVHKNGKKEGGGEEEA